MMPFEILALAVLVGGLGFAAGVRAASMSSEDLTHELVRRAVRSKMHNITTLAIDAEIERVAEGLVRSIK